MRRNAAWAVGFFVSGALQHFVSWRLYVHLAYTDSPASSRTFVDDPLTNWSIPVLGGIAVCILMSRFHGRWVELEAMEPSKIMLRSGLYAMGATFCAFESFCILASIYSALSAPRVLDIPSIPRIAIGFAVWLIEFEFFGVFPLALFLGVSFLVWSVGGVGIWRVMQRQHMK